MAAFSLHHGLSSVFRYYSNSDGIIALSHIPTEYSDMTRMSSSIFSKFFFTYVEKSDYSLGIACASFVGKFYLFFLIENGVCEIYRDDCKDVQDACTCLKILNYEYFNTDVFIYGTRLR